MECICIIYLQKCVLSVDNDMFYDWLSETRMFSIDIIIYNFYSRSISSSVISN